MDTPQLTSGETTMSYARARLYLGISCVGMWVTLSAVALLFGLPERVLSLSATWSLADVGQLVAVIFIYTFLQGAFDLFGGFVLPKEYGRYTPSLPKFLGHWFRGAALHGAILFAIGLALLTAARWGGLALTLLLFLLINVGLVYGQVWLARLLGGLGVKREGDVLLLDSPYPHLTGGIAGFKGVIAVPQAWRDAFEPDTFDLLVKRKRTLIEKRSRLLGLLAALLWNMVGFVLAYLAAGGTSSVAGLISFSFWSTLWAFLGVLLLPTLSRRAVFQGDALAVSSGEEVRRLTGALQSLDRDQDDEYRRGQAVETVFHPIPSVARRIERLATKRDNPPNAATWHLARTALYLSWANVSLLSRAVHCNIGRPEVWVFLPSD